MDIDEDIFKSEEYLKLYFNKKRAYILEYTGEQPRCLDCFDYIENNNKYAKKEIFKEIIGDKIYSIEEGDITYMENEIIHNIPTTKGASGGPIISCDKFKVIGYHVAKDLNKRKGIGKLLKYPIQEFIKRFYSENKF